MKENNDIWFWLNTTYACGAIITNEGGIIINSCPIYRVYVGQKIQKIIKYLKKSNCFIDIQPIE